MVELLEVELAIYNWIEGLHAKYQVRQRTQRTTERERERQRERERERVWRVLLMNGLRSIRTNNHRTLTVDEDWPRERERRLVNGV